MIVIILVLMLSVPSVRAEGEAQGYLNAAVRFYQKIDYDLAFEYLERARTLPHSADDLVLIELYEGVMLANLSEDEEAKRKFEAALRLNPWSQLPVAVSPKVRSQFESIRAQLTKEGNE